MKLIRVRANNFVKDEEYTLRKAGKQLVRDMVQNQGEEKEARMTRGVSEAEKEGREGGH